MSKWTLPTLDKTTKNIHCNSETNFPKATQWAKNKKLSKKLYTRFRDHKKMQYMLSYLRAALGPNVFRVFGIF